MGIRIESSVVDASAKIGDGTKIWHFSHISEGAEIGKNCMIGQGVFIGKNVRIGDHCRIQNGAQIFTGVELGDYVFIGPNVVFTNVVYPRSARDQHGNFTETFVASHASIGANATILCGISIGFKSIIGAGAVITRDIPSMVIARGTVNIAMRGIEEDL